MSARALNVLGLLKWTRQTSIVWNNVMWQVKSKCSLLFLDLHGCGEAREGMVATRMLRK